MASSKNSKKQLSAGESTQLLQALQNRFVKNMKRHKALEWPEVAKKLQAHPGKLQCLQGMEESGGEPDIIGYDKKTGEYLFCDCSAESPAGRRSLCYDKEAWEERKEHKPKYNAMDMAAEMGIALLSEADYRQLQQLGAFDTKTSSWIETPAEIRELGGALFADRRYNTVFVYHNGASSYYAARGFRGLLRV